MKPNKKPPPQGLNLTRKSDLLPVSGRMSLPKTRFVENFAVFTSKIFDILRYYLYYVLYMNKNEFFLFVPPLGMVKNISKLQDSRIGGRFLLIPWPI